MYLKRLLVVMLLILSAPVVSAASGARNGTDNIPFSDGAAWFIADRAVSYCVEVSDDFGVSQAEAEYSIRQAIGLWQSYVLKKKLPLTPMRSPSLKFEARGCDGKEDLTFYFGVRNSLVNSYLSADYKPVGFAQMTTYDFKSGWGRGFIWITPSFSITPNKEDKGFPNWRVSTTLTALIAHEVGHVLGTGHVVGTLMEANFAERLKLETEGKGRENYGLLRIDSERELIQCYYDCDVPTTYQLAGLFDVNEIAVAAAKILERPVVGIVKMRAVKGNLFSRKLQLIVSDDAGEASAEIIYEANEMSSAEDGPEVFKVAQTEHAFSKLSTAHGPNLGKLTTASGKVLPVFLSEDNGLMIQTIEDVLNPALLFQGVPQ